MKTPKILAPAGDKLSFLAAIAAGADAVYCGLKIFSARMEAGNFSIEELHRLSKLCRAHDVELYLAFNSIVKNSELGKVKNLISKLSAYVDVDALILQDPGLIPLAKSAGFKRDFHLSTLGNCTFGAGLETARRSGFSRVVVPRELTIDEIKLMAGGCPEGLELETFVHGALCYSVSGRCYWSSWFGGKSALRGRCVQPCRRIYEQKGVKKRYFSCLDFSTDVLAKILTQVPQVTTWKIEGRKKSPHYVYYATKAYRLFRDMPEKKKEAQAFLDMALGRPFTHYNVLTQRKINPLDHGSETGSGLFLGRVKNPHAPYFITRENLYPADLLRIGYEDDTSHDIQRVTRAVPKKGRFFLKKNKGFLKKGTPVYLIDRRDPVLLEALNTLENELKSFGRIKIQPVKDPSPKHVDFTQNTKKRHRITDLRLTRTKSGSKKGLPANAFWISDQGYATKPLPQKWHWLDPVVFPEEEADLVRYLNAAQKKGVRQFVLNAPWQISLFKNPKNLTLWAGPFCNVTNAETVAYLKNLGFSGVIVSPELDEKNIMSLPASAGLPLGLVVEGNWPLGISRIIAEDLKLNLPFFSPKGESAWITKRSNNYYLYPNWKLDLRSKRQALQNAGYTLFVSMFEPIPKGVKMKKRPGLWNWHLKLL